MGAVSYSPSIVTMAVFAAIFEIFNVKEWPDLQIWVRRGFELYECLLVTLLFTVTKQIIT